MNSQQPDARNEDGLGPAQNVDSLPAPEPGQPQQRRADGDQQPEIPAEPAVPPEVQAFASALPDAAAPNSALQAGIERLLEIPLTIHVELGRRKMRIRELMRIGAGAVVSLDAQSGAPLSIYANHTLIAEGEAVVVGERYGVRITDIVSPAERVRRLGAEEE